MIYLDRQKFLDSTNARIGLLYYSESFTWVNKFDRIEKTVFEDMLKPSVQKFCEEFQSLYNLKLNYETSFDLSNLGHHFYRSQMSIILNEQITDILKTNLGKYCDIYISPIEIYTDCPIAINILMNFFSIEKAKEFFQLF